MEKFKMLVLVTICVVFSKLYYSYFNSNIALIVYFASLYLLIKKLNYQKYLILVILLFNSVQIFRLVQSGIECLVHYPTNIFFITTRVMIKKMVFEFLVLYFPLHFKKLESISN